MKEPLAHKETWATRVIRVGKDFKVIKETKVGRAGRERVHRAIRAGKEIKVGRDFKAYRVGKVLVRRVIKEGKVTRGLSELMGFRAAKVGRESSAIRAHKETKAGKES